MILAYVFGVGWMQSLRPGFYQLSDLFTNRLIDVTIFLWLFWFGSSIGSFLNVVAWRMPRGVSVSGRSHCPRCETTLRSVDNIPVLGWLALGGRCRTCRLPISPRYPIVEFFVGASLAAIGIFELYNFALPHRMIHSHGGPLWAPRVTQPTIVMLIFHAVAVACSWAMGLIRWDKHRLPSKVVVFSLAAVIIPILAWPTFMVVHWKSPRPDQWWPHGQYLNAVMRVITGLVAAAIMGRSLAKGLCPNADPKMNPLGGDTKKLIDLIIILAIPAVTVGWQASLAITLMASAIALVISPFVPRNLDALARFAISIPVVLAIQITLWRQLDNAWIWPSENSDPRVLLAFGAMVLCIPIWLNDRNRVLDESEFSSGSAASETVDSEKSDDDSDDDGNNANGFQPNPATPPLDAD